MICISIAQESRRLALADMLNASGQCDLVECRLDRFSKAPEIGELLANKPKPLIMSCRRPQDGGNWSGTEPDRIALLRQCIISKADYVEIELDVADQIRKFPPAKRVISYTNLSETPPDIGKVYEEAQKKNPDVIKLTTLARTVEEAWPLVQILAKQREPTVVVGLGKPGLLLNVLGKKLGAPWTYAALEKGMEAYPGQPTARDLEQIYDYGAIDRSTRLIGVTGFDMQSVATVAALNAVLKFEGLPARCLPLPMGKIAPFQKIIEAAKLAAVVIDTQHRGPILEICGEAEESAKGSEAADVIIRKEERWHAFNTLWRSALAALETTIRRPTQAEKPLEGRVVMIVGPNAAARAIAYGVKRRGGVPIIASRDAGTAQLAAQLFQCRHVQFEAIYSTMHDVLIVCSEEKDKLRDKARSGEAGLHAGYLKPTMTVMDLSEMPLNTKLVDDARFRGCAVVSPRQVLIGQLELQIKLITGKEPPRQVLVDTLDHVIGPDADVPNEE
jgi:3-dehydroquinate dehydratase/shikimate dehydrogenase